MKLRLQGDEKNSVLKPLRLWYFVAVALENQCTSPGSCAFGLPPMGAENTPRLIFHQVSYVSLALSV